MFGWFEMIRLFLASIIIAVYGVGSFFVGENYGAKAVQAKWDSEKAATISAQRDKEAELQTNMDKLREEKNRETAKLRRTVAALTDSLRDRPERPASATTEAGASPNGCTGAELYKPDGNFLVGESARADQIRLALKECQAAYQSASK